MNQFLVFFKYFWEYYFHISQAYNKIQPGIKIFCGFRCSLTLSLSPGRRVAHALGRLSGVRPSSPLFTSYPKGWNKFKCRRVWPCILIYDLHLLLIFNCFNYFIRIFLLWFMLMVILPLRNSLWCFSNNQLITNLCGKLI